MKKIAAITTYILFVMSFVFGLMSCGKKADTGRQQQEVYRYTVIDKSKDIGSHYNWFTDKQVVGTSYIVVFRSEDGEVVSHECDASDYYSYEIGKTYIFHREIYW